MRSTKTFSMVLCALFAALTAVLSQVALPIGPIPINLATFAVFCAGALLGSKLGALSMLVWAALGAVGVPVFSLFRGGISVLFGPTGGYIIGYIPAAFLTGLFLEKLNPQNRLVFYPAAMLIGAAAYFTIGTAWFMVLTGTGLVEALSLCVIPFIPGDLLKIAAASGLVHRIRPLLRLRATSVQQA